MGKPAATNISVGLPTEKIHLPTAQHTGARAVMRKLIPDVDSRMRLALAGGRIKASSEAETDWRQHAPLEIKQLMQESDVDKLQSYKHPWNQTSARAAATATGFYEAGGNAGWISEDVAEGGVGHDSFAFEDPGWSFVRDFASIAFLPSHVEGKRARVIFPTSFDTYVPSVEDLSGNEAAPKRLRLLGGHAVLYAWYLAMWEALCAEDFQRATLLFEAALTVTIRVRVGSATSWMALESIHASERLLSQAKAMTDSFLVFTAKADLVIESFTCGKQNVIKEMVKRAVRFNGVEYNRHMQQVGGAC